MEKILTYCIKAIYYYNLKKIFGMLFKDYENFGQTYISENKNN